MLFPLPGQQRVGQEAVRVPPLMRRLAGLVVPVLVVVVDDERMQLSSGGEAGVRRRRAWPGSASAARRLRRGQGSPGSPGRNSSFTLPKTVRSRPRPQGQSGSGRAEVRVGADLFQSRGRSTGCRACRRRGWRVGLAPDGLLNRQRGLQRRRRGHIHRVGGQRAPVGFGRSPATPAEA
jgi:hypothetical protein